MAVLGLDLEYATETVMVWIKTPHLRKQSRVSSGDLLVAPLTGLHEKHKSWPSIDRRSATAPVHHSRLLGSMTNQDGQNWHGTTILAVRKGGQVVVAGDGQVSLGSTIIKSNATKVRRLGDGSVIAGFAGATADAFTLFERLEGKLEQYPTQLVRACVELAKDWRTDRYLRRLEAMMAVADKSVSLVLTGTGDVLEPEEGLIGIGSGGNFALSAARALIDRDDMDAEAIARKSMAVAADICVYTNSKIVIETL